MSTHSQSEVEIVSVNGSHLLPCACTYACAAGLARCLAIMSYIGRSKCDMYSSWYELLHPVLAITDTSKFATVQQYTTYSTSPR